MESLARKRDRIDEALAALANPYRRQLLLALLAENPQADTDPDPLDLVDSPDEPDTLAVELYHTHLPRLEAMGVIEWDKEAGEISKGPDWDSVAPLLVLIDDHLDELPAGFL